MKTNLPTLPRYRGLRIAAIALMSALAFPALADAKPKEKKKSKSHSSHSESSARHRDHDHDGDHNHRSRSTYHSHPHTSFSLSFGNGYAGQGYYWGPPNAGYYYQRPEVRYYRSRQSVPGAYLRGNSGYGSSGYRSSGYGDSGYGGASVQRALARQGYYYGPIDGSIGAGSRRAIARYQADRGLRVTGTITPGLLDSLGLR